MLDYWLHKMEGQWLTGDKGLWEEGPRDRSEAFGVCTIEWGGV